MRLITGGIMHETHTFSAEPTTLASFDVVARGEELLAFAGTQPLARRGDRRLPGARHRAGADLLRRHGVSTGVPDRQTFETLAGEL